jgi:fructokinase
MNDEGRRSTDRVLIIGEALIDRVFRQDGTVVESPGGSPANVAITLGRLGRNPTFVTSLGRDFPGQTLSAWLIDSGVQLRVLAPDGSRTAIASAYLDQWGDARYEFDIEWAITGEMNLDADVVHAGSISALLQPGADVVLQMIESARQRSTITYDPNIRPALIDDLNFAVRRIEELVALADVVKASEDDLRWLYPKISLEDASAAWLGLGPAIVVVTLGAGGAFALAASGRVECAAATVDVVDTVGAGDTFMGSLVDGLIAANLCGARRRRDLRKVGLDEMRRLLRRSAFAAAMTVSRAGANPPWRKELELAFPSRISVREKV